MNEYIQSLKLSVGQSTRIDCPNCKRKNTFSVSNQDGVLLYNCFAASCKTAGQSRTKMSAADVFSYMRNVRSSNSNNPSFEIPSYFVHQHPDLGVFADRWRLPVEGLMYDVKDQRAVFLIRDGHRVVDAVGRTLRDSSLKWKRYGVASQLFVAGHGSDVVLVEDAISASVVPTINRRLSGAALLGTSLLDEYITQLQRFSTVLVGLDPDARNKTVSLTRKLQASGLNAKALMFADDIKYRRKKDVTILQS